jgi:zeaxanthin glucosyltransferase
MSNIIIVSYPVADHYSAALQIAEELREKKYTLIFMDVTDLFQSKVISRGFEFEVLPGGPSSTYRTVKNNKVFSKIFSVFQFAKKKDICFNIDAYGPLVEKFKPVAIVLDGWLIENAILFHRYKILTLVFQTLICPNKLPGIPPPNSRYIPKNNVLSYLITECLWLRHFSKKMCDYILDTMYGRNQGVGQYAVMKKLATMINYPLKDNLERKRFSNIGFKDIPEFIVHPSELDFPHNVPINHFYIGYPIKDYYADESLHSDIIKYVENIRAINGRPLISCMLGNKGDIDFKVYKYYLKKMLAVFKEKCNYDFVVFLGNDIAPEEFVPCPSNIHFVHYLEQSLSVNIIKRFDIIITHGEMNAITNSVIAGTPMLVFPMKDNYDQNGNAARVTYHRLGAQGKLAADSVKKIMKRIDRTLTHPAYRSCIAEMRDKIYDSPHATSSKKALGFFIETADRSAIRCTDKVMYNTI